MKKLFIVVTFILILFSVSIVNANPSTQTITIPYGSFNSSTATQYNIADINATWSTSWTENVTWVATKNGTVVFYDIDLATNYITCVVNGSHIIVEDENSVMLFNWTAYNSKIYLNSYATYIKLKTDNQTTWQTKAHDNFGINYVKASGDTGHATAGTVKITFSSGAVAGVDIAETINAVVPYIVTFAVLGVIFGMFDKMTDRLVRKRR